MDPLHPGHYALYLKSRSVVYFPVAIGAAAYKHQAVIQAIAELASAISDEEEKP